MEDEEDSSIGPQLWSIHRIQVTNGIIGLDHSCTKCCTNGCTKNARLLLEHSLAGAVSASAPGVV